MTLIAAILTFAAALALGSGATAVLWARAGHGGRARERDGYAEIDIRTW